MKPILFNTEMVKAILDGRKTVTRRVVNPQPKFVNDNYGMTYMQITKPRQGVWFEGDPNKVAPYKVGDILYVRETFSIDASSGICYFKADGKENRHWKPSLHMRKDLARIFLKVTDVRVERLWEITEEQAIKEGCAPMLHSETSYIAKQDFMHLWQRVYDSNKNTAWNANPWVWVYEFKRITE